MDPSTLIISALIAGAVAAGKEVTAQAVKGGYAGLKALLAHKFGQHPDLVAPSKPPLNWAKANSTCTTSPPPTNLSCWARPIRPRCGW